MSINHDLNMYLRYGDGTGTVGRRRSLQGAEGGEEDQHPNKFSEDEGPAAALRLPAEAAAAARAERKALDGAAEAARRDRKLDLTTGRDIEPLSAEEIAASSWQLEEPIPTADTQAAPPQDNTAAEEAPQRKLTGASPKPPQSGPKDPPEPKVGQIAPGVAYNGEEMVTGAWTTPMQGVPKSAAVPKGKPRPGEKPQPSEPPCTAFCTFQEQILPEEQGWAPARPAKKPAKDNKAPAKKPAKKKK